MEMTQGQPRFYTALGYDSLIEESPLTRAWPSGGPWRLGIQARTRGGIRE